MRARRLRAGRSTTRRWRSRSDDDPFSARKLLGATVERLIADERVDLLISPDRDDAHHAHKTVAAVARTAGVTWWTWGLWRDLARPTIFSPFGDRRLAELQHVLGAHRGEVERNDYHDLLRARAIARARARRGARLRLRLRAARGGALRRAARRRRPAARARPRSTP